MTVKFASCLKTGAFVAADTRRTDMATDTFDDNIRKIDQLSMMSWIATSGHGTIGDAVRQLGKYTLNTTGRAHSADEQAAFIQQVAKTAYVEFMKFHPDDQTPVVVWLGGFDIEKMTGYICTISSRYNFEPRWCHREGEYTVGGPDTGRVLKEAQQEMNSNPLSDLERDLPVLARKIVGRTSIWSQNVGGRVQCAMAGLSGYREWYEDPLLPAEPHS